MQNLQQMAAGIDCDSDCHSSKRRQRERYQSQIEGWRAQWLADELGRRHYRQSEVLLTRLQQMPEYGLLADYYLAELYRLRQQPGDLQRALAAYDRAAASPQRLPPEWSRQRGQLRRKLGDEAGAAADLRAYLRAVPDAPDRALIEQWLRELDP